MIRHEAAILDRRNAAGKSALDLSIENGHLRVEELLRNPQRAAKELPVEVASMDKLMESLNNSSSIATSSASASGKRHHRFNAAHLFKQLDKDKSGQIAKDELRESLEEMGMVLGDKEYEAFWRSMDLDGSGSVGFREFKDGIAQLQEQRREHTQSTKHEAVDVEGL